MKSLILCLSALCVFTLQNLNAQHTFTQVYNLLQANCSTSGCHDGSAQRFNITLSETDVYNQLVNADPQNSDAVSKKNKLIKPGDPVRSFLLRKISHGISSSLHLASGEGDAMPFYS